MVARGAAKQLTKKELELCTVRQLMEVAIIINLREKSQYIHTLRLGDTQKALRSGLRISSDLLVQSIQKS
jgi:hypothetical protein